MNKIHLLSQNLTNQIAAGEVIERPASVVKELVENAIDAASTRIIVTVLDSGLKEISVQDNGEGIARADLDLAFKRHATSKINQERDLFNIATLGFRGEALASISAVSHVEITTAQADAIATFASFSGGMKLAERDAAGSKGTKIVVKDLFYNTPARLKYLKSERTELVKIIDVINRLALGHPEISFTLYNQQKILLQTAGNGNLTQVAANIYGKSVAAKMSSFEGEDPDFKVSGILSAASETRSSRNFVTILLNGRYIKNYALMNAVLAGYGNKLPHGRYPIAVLEIDVDPLLVDVNVHPTKQEVRLSKEQALSKLVTSTINAALESVSASSWQENLQSSSSLDRVDQLQFNLDRRSVDTSRVGQQLSQVQPANQLFDQSSEYVKLDHPRNDDHYLITKTWHEHVLEQTKLSPFDEKPAEELLAKADKLLANQLHDLRIVDSLGGYFIAVNDRALFIIDRAAASRRIQYDEILQQLTSQQIVSQGLLEPLTLDFGPEEFQLLLARLDLVNQLGLNLEEFGQNTFLLRTIPLWLKDASELLIRKVIDLALTAQEPVLTKVQQREAELIATSNQQRFEQKDLTRLLKTSDPYTDMNGQLIIVKLTQTDLNKMFRK